MITLKKWEACKVLRNRTPYRPQRRYLTANDLETIAFLRDQVLRFEMGLPSIS